jgi:hypothetical protein
MLDLPDLIGFIWTACPITACRKYNRNAQKAMSDQRTHFRALLIREPPNDLAIS